MLTHTLHLPPALWEIYDGPRPGWLREILVYLPCLQSLMVSGLPFFDHNALAALKAPGRHEQSPVSSRTYNIRLLLAEREPNTTAQDLSETLLRFPVLVYLDLSYTKPARDRSVLSTLSRLFNLQVLKLRGVGLKDNDVEFLANAVGIRIRLLDVRNNMLTDMAVRSLLQASFLPPEHSSTEQGAREEVPSYQNTVSRSALSSSTASFVRRPDLDEQSIKLLSRPLIGRSWIEDLPQVGITHLYIADNRLTIAGVASLLASTRLHALDVGTVDTASSIPRDPSAVPSPSPGRSHHLPGAEKLIPILRTSAKDNLTYIRVHHAVVTAAAPPKDSASANALLPELPRGRIYGGFEVPRKAELDSTNELHELPGPSQGSAFAQEVANSNVKGDVRNIRGSGASGQREDSVRTDFDASYRSPKLADSIPRYGSPIEEDPRGQKIQELLAKRPKIQTLPRRDRRDIDFPHLHPSNVPHLETLILTDVPSHIPEGSPLLDHLIRFITACSNEALLATLQAGTDYSLPPGRSRIQAEKQRARTLFALRRLVLEITPVSTSNAPSTLTSWKQPSSQNGAGSTGDRDVDNMWSVARDDFSFFEDEESDYSSTPPIDAPGEATPVDLVAELSAFRRRKKAEYEELLRQDRARRGTASSLSPSPSTPLQPSSPTSSTNALAIGPFVEGHWKGEVNVVRSPAPK